MPAGTFGISGYVFDAKSSRPVPNARVEMVGAEHAAQRATTLENGWYGVLGIPNGAELRTARGEDDEPAIQRVAVTDHESRLNFSLVENPSLLRLDGKYTLTVTADDHCSTDFWGTTRLPIPIPQGANLLGDSDSGRQQPRGRIDKPGISARCVSWQGSPRCGDSVAEKLLLRLRLLRVGLGG